MNVQKHLLLFAACLAAPFLQAQDIHMTFPHLAGKTYEFIIFQGDKTVMKADTIPSDGKFTLAVPELNRPYTGMCRWLITNTQEGGGIDMLIPGNDFSVSCTDPVPSENTIIYANNNGPQTLNRQYAEQQAIYNRFAVMEQSLKAYTEKDKAYKFFTKEYKKQVSAYDAFRKKAARESHYSAEFLTIVSITLGIPPTLGGTETEKARIIADYIANKMDWDVLYTSGHWGGIITAWADIHTQVLKDETLMAKDRDTIIKKLKPVPAKEFSDMVTILLNRKM